VQAAAWAEHFKTLLNQLQLTNTFVIQSAATDLDISCEKLSKAETRETIGALNAGKAAGPDSIPPEALKGCIGCTELKGHCFVLVSGYVC